MLSLRGHATLAVPAARLCLLRAVEEFGKHARWFAGLVPLHGRLMHLQSDDFAQPFIARQTEDKVHSVALPPAHQLIAAETGISAQNDLHLRPRRPNLLHDAFHLLPAAESGIVTG